MEVSGHPHAKADLLVGERVPITHWIGGWMGPIALVWMVWKRKNLLLPDGVWTPHFTFLCLVPVLTTMSLLPTEMSVSLYTRNICITIYCLHLVLRNAVFYRSDCSICAQQYFIVLCVNVITMTVNYLVQHTLACMGHCQLTVKCNEVFGWLLKLKFQLLHMWCL
jgi:hypothetical protein